MCADSLHIYLHGIAHAGAAREFPQPFVDDYLRMVRACAEHERDEIILRSTRMGFLTGAQAHLITHTSADLSGLSWCTSMVSP